MEFGGQGNFLAMNFVGGGEFFPLTPRAKTYIITLVDCFSRYALAIPIPGQSSEAVINAVIDNYITVYGTPRRILTDQGKCFESALFDSFRNVCCIHKICMSTYRLQWNGICKRFNQLLKHLLRKLLSKAQHSNCDVYLNFAVFSYNTSTH